MPRTAPLSASLFAVSVLACCAVAVLPGCASGNAAPAVDLDSSRWVLPADQASGSETIPVLEFAAGKVSGHLGCNRVFGTYVQEGNRLSFGPLGTTRRICAPRTMAVEQQLLSALENTALVRRTDGGLVLLDAAGAELVRLVPGQADSVR